MARDSHYEVLGLQPDADLDAIRAAYRRLSKQVHPDAGGTAALFSAVQDAYAVLSDPRKRAAYDRARQCPTPPLGPPARPSSSRRRARPSEALVGWALILLGCGLLLAYVAGR